MSFFGICFVISQNLAKSKFNDSFLRSAWIVIIDERRTINIGRIFIENFNFINVLTFLFLILLMSIHLTMVSLSVSYKRQLSLAMCPQFLKHRILCYSMNASQNSTVSMLRAYWNLSLQSLYCLFPTLSCILLSTCSKILIFKNQFLHYPG